MRYTCCYELRRNIVEKHPTMNGIDFLEVLDDPDLSVEQRQRTLFVHFIKSLIFLPQMSICIIADRICGLPPKSCIAFIV